MAPILEAKRKIGPAGDGNERPAKISKIREEEAPFPRGGASLLTPLEHKQIQIEATRDVLFEQQGAKSKKSDVDGDDGHVEQAGKKSKSKKKSKKGTELAEPEEDTVKIEGLSYKVCSVCALCNIPHN
jgi:rRNA biogenesis protein RRP5